MKKTRVRLGTLEEFAERGRAVAKLADAGERIPESRLITFEDASDLLRFLTPTRIDLFREIKLHPGSISEVARRLKRDRSAVTRDIAEMQAFGLVQVSEEVLPGHGRMKRVRASAGEIRLEATVR